MEEKHLLSSVAESIAASPNSGTLPSCPEMQRHQPRRRFSRLPCTSHIKDAAISAINSDFNQYRHVQGVCDHVAIMMNQMHGLVVNPLTDIAICCGQTEAFAAAAFSIIDKGDEVVLFDPCYETYEGCIKLAGGVPVYYSTVLTIQPAKNCLAITDEVYEHITFNSEKHISLASFPGMQKRTIITSSLSKTFSVTGWRVGWAIAPSFIASAIRNIHVKVTDSAPAPFQEAALTALRSPPEYFESLRSDYE
ncbi:hypothetical protein M0R45_027794 [Rubus argutus]|uniref:Aminotransferase class I/classII large domain-containing protein n=1 Tax=Rubus argutus TaxID=59490 RepID=A0AAW1X4V7_RUBAR